MLLVIRETKATKRGSLASRPVLSIRGEIPTHTGEVICRDQVKKGFEGHAKNVNFILKDNGRLLINIIYSE